MKTETQRASVVRSLRQGPVCGTEFLEDMIPRYAARIHELRQAGYSIETRKCSDPTHRHESRQVEYVLIGIPIGKPNKYHGITQLTLTERI